MEEIHLTCCAQHVTMGHSLGCLFFSINAFIAAGNVRALFIRATFCDVLFTLVDICGNIAEKAISQANKAKVDKSQGNKVTILKN